MANIKTEAFYQMQIRRILDQYKNDSMPSTLRDDLRMLIKDPNGADFKQWLEFNSAESYK